VNRALVASLYDTDYQWTVMDNELASIEYRLKNEPALTFLEVSALLNRHTELEKILGLNKQQQVPRKCECGSSASGFDSHTHWCPLNNTANKRGKQE
jgi:hypothetical protein